MKQKKIIIVIVAVFVLLLGASSLLYNGLREKIDSGNQLMTLPQGDAGQMPFQPQQNPNNQDFVELPEYGQTAKPTQPDVTMPSVQPTQPDVTIPSVQPTQPEVTIPSTQPTQPGVTMPSTQPTQPEVTVPSTHPIEPKPLPPALNLTVYDAKGNPINLADYAGKPIVLNFWASWCGPCQREMPDFQETFEELDGQVQFLMVNMTTSETVTSAKSFIESNGYTFPVFYDTKGTAASAYSIQSLPTTYFLNAEGEKVAYAVGFIDKATLLKGIGMVTE